MIDEIKFKTYVVLPLVYDDALSFYELVSKCVQKINEMIPVVNVAQEEIDKKVSEAVQELIDNGTLNDIINNQIFNELNEKVNTNTNNINELTNKTNENTTDITALNEKVSTNTNSINALTGDVNSLKVKTTSLEEKNNELTTSTNNLKSEDIRIKQNISMIEKKIGKYITPEMYGAIGDNTHDDTEAINQAITNALADKACLLLLGKYKITQPLTNIKNLTILGLNSAIESTYTGDQALIIFESCNVTGLTIISNTQHTGSVLYSDNWNNAKFTNITIYYGANGIRFNSAGSGFASHITNFNISNCSEAGIRIESGADYFIQDGIINQCGVGIIADRCDGVYCANVDIIACGYAFKGFCYTGNLGSLFFTNVLFDSSENDNFRIDGTSGSYVCNSLHMANCWFSNNSGHNSCFLSLVRNGEITSSIFQYSKFAGLNIDKSQNIKITGCTFYANSRKDNPHILLTSNNRVTINGCTIGGIGTGNFSAYGANRSIYMSGNSYSMITNNTVYENTDNDIIGIESSAVVKNNIGIADR